MYNFPHVFPPLRSPPPRIPPLRSPPPRSPPPRIPIFTLRRIPPPRSPPPRSPSPRISPTTYSPTTYPDLHPATTTTTETDELLHDTTCFWSATDSNRIIIIIYLARPLTYCGRDIWNCSKVNFLF